MTFQEVELLDEFQRRLLLGYKEPVVEDDEDDIDQAELDALMQQQLRAFEAQTLPREPRNPWSKRS